MTTSSRAPTIPDHLKRYFWDTDMSRVDVRQKPVWLVARILDKGDTEAIEWLRQTFSKKDIVETLKKSRDLSLRSASFWARIYGVPFWQVLCFQEPYRSARRTLWPY